MKNAEQAERQFTKLFTNALEKQNSGSDAKAQQLYKRALRIQENASAYVNLGLIAYKSGNRKRAEYLYRKALKLDPACHAALLNMGVISTGNGDIGEAVLFYTKSIASKPTPEAYANLADLYSREERYTEAMALLTKALEINPFHAQTLGNMAMIAWSQNQYDVAVDAARRAIALGADLNARVNLGVILMTMGQYQEGFREYAWRFAAYGTQMRGPETMPIWKGRQHVPGTLYVWPEQGLGDEILYAGYMQEVAKRADHVIWECEPRLVSLFQRGAPDNVTVIPKAEKPPEATAQIPAGCLAQMYQPTAPRLQYLTPDPDRVATFKSMLPKDKRIVGISWASTNAQFGHKKSLSLEDFAGFIEDEDCHCVSLQYGDYAHGPLHRIPELDLTRDIDGIAALVKACDVVVTASNTVAHIAGALGVPCIVMVSERGGKLWYWGTEDETIWYRSVVIQRFDRVSRETSPA